MFIIIFGFRNRAHNMATVRLACRNGHVAAHGLFKVVRHFTLFWIPLFPVKTTYLTSCSQCGLRLAWTGEQAEEIATQHTIPASAPGDPVSPPLQSPPALPAFGAGQAGTGGTPAAAPAAAPAAPAAPAGWYADPEGDPRRRWWDGRGWTHPLPGCRHRLSRRPASPSGPAPKPAAGRPR